MLLIYLSRICSFELAEVTGSPFCRERGGVGVMLFDAEVGFGIQQPIVNSSVGIDFHL